MQGSKIPRLIHIQTTTLIEFPEKSTIIRIGKPSADWTPDIDVSDFPNSDIVSHTHLEIRIEGNSYFIEDLGSTNGTYLNRSRLAPFTSCQLHVGDRIDLGKDDLFTFLFREAKQNSTKPSNFSIARNKKQVSSLNTPLKDFSTSSNKTTSAKIPKQPQEKPSISIGLINQFNNVASGFSNSIARLIRWLIGIAIKVGIVFIILFLVGLLAALFFKGSVNTPQRANETPIVVGSSSTPLVEAPVKPPVIKTKLPVINLPKRRLVEPTRIRVPYTNENRPSGQSSCDCPYDRATNNSICGGRSAYAKPGGKEPACYVGETTARERWWNNDNNSFVDRERLGK
jgi:pSer/pThr/pTyr-binding forkhead associated (FHA) protein